jgi:beta-lactamase regulating signal transducer with metallopeptidase domain
MTPLLQWLTSPAWTQIVKALLHSLWQGALIAVGLALLLKRLRSPVARYRLSLAALAGIVFAAIITWAVINASEHRTVSQLQPTSAAESQPTSNTAITAQNSEPPIIVVMRKNAVAIPWTAWIALAWLAGAALMLARTSVKVAGAEKLRRSCRPLEDATIQTLLAETRRALGLARQVRIGLTNKLTSPAVVGVFVPMLILPLSLVTSLTPEQIRFVLLHELAHIQRGDYLANLFQFFAESLLFFNPAVWWISHLVRREREACCDALAIALSGAPADYARTLVHVAESVLEPAPLAAPAFGGRREPSSLAERIQRLLVPGYRPSLRLTWRAMLAALLSGSVLLFLSALGTRFTVAAILTPQQRIEKIEKKMAEYGQKPEVSNPNEPRKEIPVTAHLKTPDGVPLPEGVRITLHSLTRNHGSVSSTRMLRDGTISDTISGGQIWIEAEADGFAPTIAGPLDGDNAERLDAGEIILNPGFTLTLHVTDSNSGAAVQNASVHTQFWLRYVGHGLQNVGDFKTDANGAVTLSHCADQPLTVTVNAPDHQILDYKFENLTAGQTLEVGLKPGAVVTGTVLDKTSGNGIAGATVRVLSEKINFLPRYAWGDLARVIGQTDMYGHFTNSQLRAGTAYSLGISAPGHESMVVDVTPGPDGFSAKLGPELVVRGTVIGDLSGLQRINGNYCLNRTSDEFVANISYWLPLQVTNGIAHFEFTNRAPGHVSLSARDKGGFDRDVDAPVDNWVIDLTKTEIPAAAAVTNVLKREVVFHFKDKSGGSPRGVVSVMIPDNLDPKHLSAHDEEKEITNGEVHAEIAIGGTTTIEPKKMVGYSFDYFIPVAVTNGPGPLVLDVPVIPAGAIYAKARNSDGTAAGGLFFGIDELKTSPKRNPNSTLLGNNGDSVSGNLPRKWVSGPLPLGGTYAVTGWRGNSFCMSQPITLTEENPDAEVELQFPPAKTLEGIVLDPNGQPVRDVDVKANFILQKKHNFQLQPITTDEKGKFRLENCTPGVGDYTIEPEVPGLMAERVTLDFGNQPRTIRLKRGRTISGRVVEAGTGYAIPGAEVSAADIDTLKMPSLKTRTDSEGHFEFTSLGDVNYTLFLDAGQQVTSKTYRGNVDTNITVELKLYPWSIVKPKAPETALVEKPITALTVANTNRVYTSAARQRIYEKLNNIVFDKISFPGLPLSEVIRNLNEQTERRDPDQEGVNFLMVRDKPVGTTNAAEEEDLGAVTISVDPPLANMRLVDVLEAIAKCADHPIKYSLTDIGIEFSLKRRDEPELFTRTFKVDTNTFYWGLQNVGAYSLTNKSDIQAAVSNFFDEIGLNLTPPKSVYFNRRQGTLTVHATQDDLDIIEAAINTLNIAPAKVNVKVRFVETDPDKGGLDTLLKNILTNSMSSSTDSVHFMTGILTKPQFMSVLTTLVPGKDRASLLNEGEVTTLSGRQAQFQVVDVQTIVTGFSTTIANNGTNFGYQTTNMPFGSALDVVPIVSADGYTISMTVIPTVTEFLGYADPKELSKYDEHLQHGQLPLPQYRVRQTTTTVNISDGQTLVIGNLSDELVTRKPDGSELKRAFAGTKKKKQLLVFITPTIIRPSGNPIQSTDYYDGPVL